MFNGLVTAEIRLPTMLLKHSVVIVAVLVSYGMLYILSFNSWKYTHGCAIYIGILPPPPINLQPNTWLYFLHRYSTRRGTHTHTHTQSKNIPQSTSVIREQSPPDIQCGQCCLYTKLAGLLLLLSLPQPQGLQPVSRESSTTKERLFLTHLLYCY